MLPATEEFDIPFSSDDAVIECEAIDAEAGEPEGWPTWTDAFCYVPTEDDSQWATENLELPPPGPTDEDWDEYHRWCEDCERRNALRRMADTEYETRMRFGA